MMQLPHKRQSERVRMDSAGRIVVPSKFRKAIGVESGNELIVTLEGDILKVRTVESALKNARALLRKRIGPGRSLADELIEERRKEARRD